MRAGVRGFVALPCLAVLVVVGGCARGRCCPPAVRASAAPATVDAPPVASAPAPGWVKARRVEALEAVHSVARARIASARGFTQEVERAYAHALETLRYAPAGTPGAALKAQVEAERLAPPIPKPAERLPGIEPDPVRFGVYEVADLVALMDTLQFPRVELVGPEGARPEPRAGQLGGGLYDVLPAADGPSIPRHATEVELRGEALVLRAPPERQDAMRIYLATLRELWPPLTAPLETTSVVVEIHQVADLVAALERLGPQVDLTQAAPTGVPAHGERAWVLRGDEALAVRPAPSPEPTLADPPPGTAVERLRRTLLSLVGEHMQRTRGPRHGDALVIVASGSSNLVVRGSRESQDAVHALLEGWRETWRARWPEAFEPM